MKSETQAPAPVDAAPSAALNKAVEVTLAKVHWHQGEEKAAGEKINVSPDQVEFLRREGVIKKEA
ncbi:DUF7210 family protein [Pseudomonas aeruginosa]|uniref:DUF7210 family protein n=1 Tax=Pseudomonas aeruginosa TaxID=287 RepID=UPI00050DA684|nr:hypothetical protein [Pseudomonas aeruginosa]EIU3787367.1 hypothetical protein [Pseudomonas aeruginosa]EKV0487524.1 hypothetical protein [Pseudomonas aeruginosa]KGB87341.1 hypothetical protein JF43_11955 [Pseudomonas aeruginosa]MCU9108324.1 hypothetical protein [Pseudomonas aeruginosa]WGX88855.1 hypothetical protein QJ960_07035 [Pseudomonas aeruginosa]